MTNLFMWWASMIDKAEDRAGIVGFLTVLMSGVFVFCTFLGVLAWALGDTLFLALVLSSPLLFILYGYYKIWEGQKTNGR